MSVQSTGGAVSWMRRWDGQEWKFNPYWESLSQSWKNLTGSETADTTGSTLSSSGGATTPTLAASGGNSDSGCWVWVDEDWQPSIGTTVIGGIPQAGPMAPERMSPFNRIMGEDASDYPAPVIVSIDYATLCAGTVTGLGERDVEGIRRENELYLGDQGRYAFSNRAVLEKRAVSQLPTASSGALYAQLATGNISVTPVANPKGYRWIHKEGDWIEYNTQGQAVAYGDRNDNVIWLVRDTDGIVRGVADAHGHVLYSLHYNGALLTEVRDYPVSSNSLDLPARSVSYQYDDKNRMTVVTDVRGNTTHYEYDGQNHIIKVTDQEGHFEKFGYNGDTVGERTAADGAVTDYVFEYDDTNKQFASTITGPATSAGRRKEDYTHNRVGQLVRRIVNGRIEEEVRYDTGARAEQHTNARGFSTRIVRNEFDQVVEVDQADGTVVKHDFSALNLQPTEDTDPLGVKADYQYDTKGNLLKKTEAAGTPDERVTDYEVNGLGQTTQSTIRGRTEANGTVTADAVWRFSYDVTGQIGSVTDPEGNTGQYVYNRAGFVVRSTDPRGHATLFETDAAGNLTKVTDELGHVSAYTYDKAGNLLTLTDQQAKVTRTAYDAANRVVRVTSPTGGIFAREYNGQGQPVTQTDEDGRASRFDFDAFLLLTKLTDARGNVTQLGYQIPDGTSTGSPGSLYQATETRYPTYTEQRRYDQLERATSRVIVNPKGQGTVTMSSAVAYEQRGLIKSETDANNQTKLYNYNNLGQLVETTDTLGRRTALQYDARGNISQVQDTNGNVNRFEYNRSDRLTRQVRPLGQATHYEYDGNGNVTRVSDGKGNEIVYVYDDANRLKRREVTPAGASSPDIVCNYTYDDAGNLKTWSEGATSSVLTYDDNNRKLSETVSYGNGLVLAYSYTYSDAGYKKTLTYPDGTVVTYTHDPNGELAAIDIPGEGSLAVSDWNWLAPKQIVLPGGGGQQLTQDGLLSMTGLVVKNAAQQSVFNLTSAYGNLEELTGRGIDGASYTYTHDTELHLIGVSGSRAESFTVDGLGNRLTHGNSAPWQYDANNRLLQADGVGYEYDDAGNLTRKTAAGAVTHYEYDGLNRLIAIKSDNGATVATYGYDPMGRRLWKDVGGARTYFLYCDEGLLAEANSSGNIVSQFGWKPDNTWGTDPVFIKTTIGSGPSAQVGYAYFANDHVGTPLRATDKQGSVVWSASYTEFGSATLAIDNQLLMNLRMSGQYFDSESGLSYNYNRYYDAAIGRYTTEDPTGIAADLSFYVYAQGAPLYWIDPYGLNIGAPGTVESVIPIWGSGRAAINDFQCGRWGWGLFNAGLTALDIFGATSLVKAGWKVGAHAWKSATRPWLGRTGFAAKGQHVHHAIVPQRSFGESMEWLFNQPWNLQPLTPPPGISPGLWHMMVEGRTPGLNQLQQWWYGMPDWFKAAEASAVGKASNLPRKKCDCDE